MKRSSTKSQNKSSSRSVKRIDFKPNTTIYSKDTFFEGNPFKINVNVEPHLPNKATIELKERY